LEECVGNSCICHHLSQKKEVTFEYYDDDDDDDTSFSGIGNYNTDSRQGENILLQEESLNYDDDDEYSLVYDDDDKRIAVI
jgi:hypothetical protein